MFKPTLTIVFLTLALPFNSYASDSDRIDQLEKQIQEINLRLTKIETLLSNPSADQKPVASSDGWKSVANWRKLTTDMGPSDVRNLLGEPDRVDGGNIATWYYQNRGTVIFSDGKVFQWREPQR